MFTKALITAFALIGAQAIKLESSAEIDWTNFSFNATDPQLAQIETERWGGDGMAAF